MLWLRSRSVARAPLRRAWRGNTGGIPGLARNREPHCGESECPLRSRRPSVARSPLSVPQTLPTRRDTVAGLVSLCAAAALSACGPATEPVSGLDSKALGAAGADRGALRVLPASASAVDFATALLEPGEIAALPEQALEYSQLHELPERFERTPRFNVYLAEPVLALGPTLVLADPYQAPETSARLRQANIAVLTLPVIASWSDARATLGMLGDKFGRAERARELIGELDARVARLREHASRSRRWRALVYSSFGGVGSSAGAKTTIDDVLALAGLENLAATAGRTGHFELGFEGLIAFDPELIVVSAPLRMAPSAQGDLGGAAERVLLSAAPLSTLRAVRERQFVALPAWLFATGSHELVRAAEVLRERVDALDERTRADGAK